MGENKSRKESESENGVGKARARKSMWARKRQRGSLKFLSRLCKSGEPWRSVERDLRPGKEFWNWTKGHANMNNSELHIPPRTGNPCRDPFESFPSKAVSDPESCSLGSFGDSTRCFVDVA